jgi:hypothetical protein
LFFRGHVALYVTNVIFDISDVSCNRSEAFLHDVCECVDLLIDRQVCGKSVDPLFCEGLVEESDYSAMSGIAVVDICEVVI